MAAAVGVCPEWGRWGGELGVERRMRTEEAKRKIRAALIWSFRVIWQFIMGKFEMHRRCF